MCNGNKCETPCQGCTCDTNNVKLTIDVTPQQMGLLEEACTLTEFSVEDWLLFSGITEAMNMLKRSNSIKEEHSL